MNRTLLHIIFFFFAIQIAVAQDVHFSQFYNAPANINPALTGNFVGDTRYIANYRNQWRKVPVNYLTFAGTYDTKIQPKFLKIGQLAIGGHFHYDVAGDSKLYNTQLSGMASYTKPLNESHRLSVGLGLGLSAVGFDYGDLRFNSQFDGEVYAPSLASGEIDADAQNSVVYVDMNIGGAWHYEVKKSRSFVDVAIAAIHFNAPKINFYADEKESLDTRLNLFVNGAIQLKKQFDIHARTLIQKKGKEKEFLVGASGRYYIDPHKAKETAIELGLNYRFFDLGDAWSPTLEFHHKSWTFGASYDINISDFNTATDNRGGLELAFIYRTAKTPELKPKDCKIF